MLRQKQGQRQNTVDRRPHRAHKHNMKNFILTLVGVLGLTAGSWGQSSSVLNGPQSLYLQNMILDTVPFGTVDLSNIEFVRGNSYDYGPGNRGVYYQSSGTNPMLTVQVKQGTLTGNPPYSITVSGNTPNWSAFFFSSWGGDDYGNMTNYASQNIVGSAPSTFGSSNFVNGLDANGLPTGGTAQSSESGGSVPESLLSGLTYENGQWAPAPAQ